MQKQFEVLVSMQGTGTIAQSNLLELLKTQFFIRIYHSISKYIWWKSFLSVWNSPPSVKNVKKIGNTSSI